MHETIKMLGEDRQRELLAEAERLNPGPFARREGGRLRKLWSSGAVRCALVGTTVWLRRGRLRPSEARALDEPELPG